MNKNNLEVYTGNGYTFSLNEQYSHPEWAKTYVLVPKWYYPERHEVRYTITPESYKRLSLWYNARRLTGTGYIFRQTPVRGTSKYKNCIYRRTCIGFKRECQENEKYPELVRSKRAGAIRYQFMEYDYPHKHRSERCWKRSKKKKQWM